MTELDLAAAAPDILTRFSALGPLAWVLSAVGVIAASAALIAFGMVLTRLGVAVALLFAHIGKAVRGFGGDLVRFIGGFIVSLLLLPVALARLVMLKPVPARACLHSSWRELRDAGRALISALLLRPLQLLGFSSIVGHVAARLPVALDGKEHTSLRSDSAVFEGYTVLRELARGGSGARLLVAQPDDRTRRRISLAHGLVVIKSFDFDEGTRLAEMLRESRSLDSARTLGLVLDHEASQRRFHYVMRYYEGVDLGKFVRTLHETAASAKVDAHAFDRTPGLDRERLVLVTSLVRDIVATLRDWHGAGLMHKDIKPENAIVHEGRATVVDLGLVTPLASQMTLTTHGTEYFRDPELVRQAMRGTRVSEVDAARFDLYGAGAVLYFVLEGTFPAHGVLSRFRKESPACLQWIARRAMAEFDTRYANADEMLRDLDHAIFGGDPAAVRPADLPSMRSGVEEAKSDEERFLDATLRSDSVRTPVPPPDATTSTRPTLRLINWWTGAYRVETVRPLPQEPPAVRPRALAAAIGVLIMALLALGAVVGIAATLTNQ